MAFFFCRLIAPRPTFAHDMSPTEAEAMRAHAGYWHSLAAEGRALIFGPVADPAGAWGMAVLETADRDEADTLTLADPVVRADLGLYFELLPMPTAVLGTR